MKNKILCSFLFIIGMLRCNVNNLQAVGDDSAVHYSGYSENVQYHPSSNDYSALVYATITPNTEVIAGIYSTKMDMEFRTDANFEIESVESPNTQYDFWFFDVSSTEGTIKKRLFIRMKNGLNYADSDTFTLKMKLTGLSYEEVKKSTYMIHNSGGGASSEIIVPGLGIIPSGTVTQYYKKENPSSIGRPMFGVDNQSLSSPIYLSKANITIGYKYIGEVPENIGEPQRDVIEFGTQYIPKQFPSEVSNYTFSGWYMDPEATTLFNYSVEIKSNLILYGKWERKVKPNKPEISEPSKPSESINSAKPKQPNLNVDDKQVKKIRIRFFRKNGYAQNANSKNGLQKTVSTFDVSNKKIIGYSYLLIISGIVLTHIWTRKRDDKS